jgi:hypothetical protein
MCLKTETESVPAPSRVANAGTVCFGCLTNGSVCDLQDREGLVHARVVFSEVPESAEIRNIIDGAQMTEVRWEVDGLPPRSIFEIQLL